MKSRVMPPILVSVLLAALTAQAENKSALSSARELAKQGLSAYDSGQYEEAAEKLARAYQVVHVPTLAVNQARALVKLGQWVAAAELYIEAQNIPKDKSWQSTQVDAQRDAAKERAELLPRIPRLTIALSGAVPTEVEVAIDGTAVPTALLEAEQMVDPGTRNIKATRGADLLTESVTIKEGERTTVTLRFDPRGAPTAIRQSTSSRNSEAQVPLTAPTQPTPAAQSRSQSRQKTLGWIGIGLGGVGLIAGGITGVVAMSKRTTLRDSNLCSDDGNHCDSAVDDTVDTYNGLRTASTVAFVAGGVLATAGVTLLLTTPKRSSEAKVGVWLSPSGVALRGGF